MNVLIALCRREWQEHKNAFGWSPVLIFGILVAITFIGLIIGSTAQITTHANSKTTQGDSSEIVVERGSSSLQDFVDKATSEHSWSDTELAEHLKEMRGGIAEVFIFVYFLVVFFVLLGTLYDDRKDRTVLFWKSLPASDTETVLSKLITALWLAPIATIAMILASQVFLLIVASVLVFGSEHISVFALWRHSGLVSGTAELVGTLFTQSFWSLPLWGWLLLVSATAARMPFVWAVLIPAGLVLVERQLFKTHHLAQSMANHLEVRDSLWITSDMWMGIAIGITFICGAIYFRRRNNEI